MGLRYFCSIALTIAVTTALCSSASAAPPATRPVDADMFFDLASVEMSKILGDGKQSSQAFTDLDLALWLVWARGNEADKQLLRRAMELPGPPRHPKMKQELYDHLLFINGVTAYASLGEVERARELLKGVEPMPLGMADFSSDTSIMLAKLITNDVDQVVAWARDEKTSLFSIQLALSMVNQAPADSARDKLLDVFADRSRQGEELPSQLRSLAKVQCELGQLDAARKTVSEMQFTYHRLDAQRNLAAHLNRVGRRDDAAAVLVEGLTTAKKIDSGAADLLLQLANDADELGFPKVTASAVAVAMPLLRAETRPAAFAWLRAATLSAASAPQFFEEAINAGIRATKAEEDEKSRRRNELSVAAAYARAGRDILSTEWFDRSRNGPEAQDLSVSEEFNHLLVALVRRGEINAAEALVKRHFTDETDRSYFYGNTALVLADRAEFERAWAFGLLCTKYEANRLATLRQIAYQESAAGHGDRVLAKIAMIPDSRQRAIVYMGVGERMVRKRDVNRYYSVRIP